MDRKGRETRTGRGGWLSTLGGAVLLVGVGFAIGLVAGAAFEEPDLVIDQIAGRGTEVPVGEIDAIGDDFQEGSIDPGPEDATGAAEEPPAPAPAEVALPEVASAPQARTPAAPAPRSVPRGTGYSVQVGAFDDRAAADRIARKLSDVRLPVYVAEAGASGAARYRVRVGPVASESEAKGLARRIDTELGLPTWVLREEGS